MDNKHLDILHDHYKETFSYIRERERIRDQLFIYLILITGALFFQIQYPTDFQGSLGNIIIQEAEINLGALPLAALLSVTWTLFLVLTIRYCQSAIHVERQYIYLHRLEEKISEIFGDEELYCREGKAYLKKYPLFSNWVWFFYTILFPLIIISSISTLMIFEYSQLSYPNFHRVFDTVLAIGIALSLILYRFVPLLQNKRGKQVNKQKSRGIAPKPLGNTPE